MGNLLSLNRFNVQRPDAGIVRVVSGATVTIYSTMADGTAAVTSAGAVTAGAIKATIYEDRNSLVIKTNPITADEQGLVEFYTQSGEVHILIEAVDGTRYGIPWFPIYSSGSAARVESLFDAYGAKGDGVTDDTASLMAAFNSLPTFGGVLIASAGKRYLITSTLDFTSKTVVLQGSGGSIDHTTTNRAAIVKKSTMSGTGLIIGGEGSSVYSLRVEGQVGNSGDGVQIKGSRCALYGVSVVKMGGVGIRVGDEAVANCNVWYIGHCSSRGNVGDGIYIHSNSGAGSQDANAGTMVGTTADTNGGHGIHLKNASGNSFFGNLAQSNTGYGIYIDGNADSNIFIGGDIEANTAGGINVASVSANDNTFAFIWGENPYQSTTEASVNSRTRFIGLGYAGKWSGIGGGVAGEFFTNGPRGIPNTFDGYMQLYYDSFPKIRIGIDPNVPTTGLALAQIMTDASSKVYILSRDISTGTIKLQAGAGLAGFLLLDHNAGVLETNERLLLTENTTPANAATNKAYLYLKDNGAGKTGLYMRFQSGAEVGPIAIEP